MRPGQQQNKRMRNRGGRKGPNPLSRSFESNGPDVKIRGTAQHIADKYTTLARDAAASGDRIMAENYLQHAEHYGRIVAAAQGQYMPPQVERDFGDEDDMDGEEGGDFAAPVQNERPPFNERQNGERAYNDRQQNDRQYGDRQQNGDRQGYRDNNGPREGRDNQNGRDHQNGRDNQNGQRFDRNDQRRDRNDRPFRDRDGQPRDNRQDRQPSQGDRPYGERGDERQAPVAAGTGPQPDVAENGENGQRFERRENRRDRQRFQDRSGERRFEERFGRAAGGEGPREGQAPAEASGAPEPAQGVQPEPYTAEAAAVMAAPEPVMEEARAPVAAAAEPVAAETAVEPRRRGRPRRERPEVSAGPDTNGEVPVAADSSPATVSADAVPATADAPEAADAAAPKRRPGRPRKKKTDGEGGEGGHGDGHLPAFLLASNG